MMLDDLGTIISTITHPHLPPQFHILLHRPVPTFEPLNAPDCCFITRSLYPCDRWDYCRLASSVILGSLHPIPIRFVDRPVAWWIGRGRLAKKAVEAIDIMVEGSEDGEGIERFVTLCKVGFSYPGVTRRRRKKK